MKRRTVAISGLSVAGTLAPGLPVIRTLRAAPEFVAGWRVVGLSYDPLDPPNYDAELLDKSYLLPYPGYGSDRLFERLQLIHERENLDAILPTLDSELLHYIKLAPRLLELGIKVLLPSEDAFKLRSKAELPLVAERTGIRVPRSLIARSADDAVRQAMQLPFPVVVKGNLHGATVVYTLDGIAPAAATHATQWGYPVVLQEFIPGIEFDVAALGDARHRLIGAVPMKKLQLDDRGKAWGALTIDDPSLCRAAEQAIAGLKWVGPLELELVRHRDTGEPYLIELNPRFPAWIHLTAAAEQNLPWAHLRLISGEEVPRFAGYLAGVLQLRRALDQTCSLGAYESLTTRGEVDLTQPDPKWVQPRYVPLPEPGAPLPKKPRQLTLELPAAEPVPRSDQAASRAADAELLPYEKPSIVRHHGGIGNRIGGRAGHRYVDNIDGVTIDSLVERFGSPLFVFSERTLRRRARLLREAFSRRWASIRLAWSYKTNYLDAICGILHQEGWDAEVVSDLEYAMARRLGIAGSRIICNGAYKPLAWLEQAAQEEALVQIDHFDELDALEKVARRRGQPLGVGLRVNMRVDALGSGTWERFGFNLDNGEVLDAILRIIASDSLRLVSLHCHLGTYISDAAAYRQATARLAELLLSTEALAGYTLPYINLGGGFPSSNILGGAYGEGDPDGPDIEPFAEAICDELHAAFAGHKNKPTLILESGRYLVDDAGSLITTVVGTRRLASGERGLVLDAGLNALYTAHWYRHRVMPTLPIPGPVEETTLHGPLCMNIDVLRASLPLPPMVPGHRALISPVGAYNVTQWMQFSQARPGVVMIAQDGAVAVIRRAETIADVKGAEELPLRFAPPTSLK
jgi:diaminopimelate decarboxylase